MSDPADVSADAISALLTGLTSALSEAQELMAESPPTDAFGRPLPTYQIPHLDFTFEIETVRTTSTDGRPLGFALRPSSGGKQSISSTISGRVVAVPSNGGLPQTQILVTQSSDVLQIQVVNTAGEVLPSTRVELEFDADASLALYDTTLTSQARLTLLPSLQVATDARGVAEAGVDRQQVPAGKSAVVLIRVAGSETRVAIGREV